MYNTFLMEQNHRGFATRSNFEELSGLEWKDQTSLHDPVHNQS